MRLPESWKDELFLGRLLFSFNMNPNGKWNLDGRGSCGTLVQEHIIIAMHLAYFPKHLFFNRLQAITKRTPVASGWWLSFHSPCHCSALTTSLVPSFSERRFPDPPMFQVVPVVWFMLSSSWFHIHSSNFVLELELLISFFISGERIRCSPQWYLMLLKTALKILRGSYTGWQIMNLSSPLQMGQMVLHKLLLVWRNSISLATFFKILFNLSSW